MKAPRLLWIIPALLLSLALLVPWHHPDWPRLEDYLFDLAHVPAGALLVVLLKQFGLRQRAVLRMMFCLVLLALVEIVQPWVGRDAGAIDWLLGVVGVLLVEARAPTRVRRRFVQGGLAFAALLPVVLLTGDRLAMHRDFPVLSEFRRPLEAGRWVMNGGVVEVDDHTLWLFVDGSRDYPGLFLEELVPDWRGQLTLRLRLHLEAPENRAVIIRVDDTELDAPAGLRGEVEWTLRPGVQDVVLPLDTLLEARDRSIDRSAVKRLGVFFIETHPWEALGIERVELLPYLPDAVDWKLTRVTPAAGPGPAR